MFKNKVILGGFIILLGIILYYSLSTKEPFDKRKLSEREEYKQTILQMEGSPIDLNSFEHFDYFDPKESFVVEAIFTKTPQNKPFSMQMTDGTSLEMPMVGKVSFEINKKKQTLTVFDEDAHFLLPFYDTTNGKTTYGGGRYINIPKDNLDGETLVIDFNDAHNFYCAYSERFICPIPPKGNLINLAIEAGEKNYHN